MADLKTTAEGRERMRRHAEWITAHAGHSATELRAVARAVPLILPDLDTLLAENAKLHGDLDAIAIAMGLANEHEGHVQRADIERLCEDALAARRAEAMLADVQSENAKLRAVAEAARDLAECDAHGEFCDVPILAEKRGRARGRDDSDDWNEAECDCCAGRARKALLAALEAP